MTGVDSEMLRKIPFLEGADPDVLERLAEVAVERRFEPGQVIIQEDSTGREMYLIDEGLVEIVKGRGAQEMVLARRGPGAFFGEMSLIEAQPRSATVRALAPTHLIEFSEQDVRSVLLQQPLLLYQVSQVLSARLRETDRHMIADLQRKNEELARAYRELKEAQAGLVKKERMEHELGLARDLQQSILPREFPRLPGLSVAARSRPAREVGGDFYDVIPLDDGCVGLVMADVSDKGMRAALYMALTRSLIRAEAKRMSSPRQVLLDVHRLLLEITQTNMFVTAFFGVVDPQQSTLLYARAGHDHPLLFSPSSGECQFLTADGMLLGLLEDVILVEVRLDLRAGDLLVLYTDGITDAPSPEGEFFGLERLLETVRSAGRLNAQGLCDHIFESVGRFQAGADQYDDMAVLVVEAAGVQR